MGFENFGTISYTAETKVTDFVTYLEQGKVMTVRCRRCGGRYFPPRMDCPKCLLSDMEWFEIKRAGKLSTYTVVNYAPTGFENDVPYVLAIVEFEDGVKILARLSRSISDSDIKIGMGLKVVPVKLHDRRISYEFRKA